MEPPLIQTDRTYDVVYADPPWRYAQASVRGACPYPTLTLDALKRMAIPANPARAALFLWATVPQLPAALELMAAWGFQYKSAWVWLKRTATGKLHFGPGFWARGCVELVLIGTKGRGMYALVADHAVRGALLDSHDLTGCFDGPVAHHSRKPEAMRDRVRGLFGANAASLRFLELFARPPCTTAGWDVWGHDIPPFPAPCTIQAGEQQSNQRDPAAEACGICRKEWSGAEILGGNTGWVPKYPVYVEDPATPALGPQPGPIGSPKCSGGPTSEPCQ